MIQTSRSDKDWSVYEPRYRFHEIADAEFTAYYEEKTVYLMIKLFIANTMYTIYSISIDLKFLMYGNV